MKVKGFSSRFRILIKMIKVKEIFAILAKDIVDNIWVQQWVVLKELEVYLYWIEESLSRQKMGPTDSMENILPDSIDEKKGSVFKQAISPKRKLWLQKRKPFLLAYVKFAERAEFEIHA